MENKNKTMMIIIILLLVVLLGTIVGISLYVLGNINKQPEDIIVTPPPVVTVTLDDLVTFNAGEITKNLKKEGLYDYVLRAEFSFELNTKNDAEGKLLALMESKIDMVRDIINSVIGNTTYEEITSPNGEDRLKEIILEKVQDAFQTTEIWEVNTPSFLTNRIN